MAADEPRLLGASSERPGDAIADLVESLGRTGSEVFRTCRVAGIDSRALDHLPSFPDRLTLLGCGAAGFCCVFPCGINIPRILGLSRSPRLCQERYRGDQDIHARLD